jgi:hypothetical protein
MSHEHDWKPGTILGIRCGLAAEDCEDRVEVTPSDYVHDCERPIHYKWCICGKVLF